MRCLYSQTSLIMVFIHCFDNDEKLNKDNKNDRLRTEGRFYIFIIIHFMISWFLAQA